MKWKLLWSVPPVAALLACAFFLQGASPNVFALRDARIVRVSGPAIEKGVVVLRNGLIEAVGENIAPPPDAWVIDASGLTVYPGLIDALSTWGVGGNQNGAGGGRGGANPGAGANAAPVRGPEDRPSNTAWVKAADLIEPNDAKIQQARDAGYTTAVSFPGGNIFSGQGSAFNLAGERAGEMVLADAVGQMIALRGAGRGSFPGSLMGSFAYIRQIYIDADHYQTAKSIYEKHPESLRRPAYDRALEGVLASPMALLPGDRAVEIERMLSLIRELNLKAAIYGGQEAWRIPDAIKKADVPMLLSLRYPERNRNADPALEEPLRVLEYRDKAPASAGALAKAGVRFAFYSDGTANPRDLLRAVKKAIDAGLTTDQAVRALTLSPAEIFGFADRAGSIDKGKIANLLVTDGDLFAENTKIKFVFVDGEKFEPRASDPDRSKGSKQK